MLHNLHSRSLFPSGQRWRALLFPTLSVSGPWNTTNIHPFVQIICSCNLLKTEKYLDQGDDFHLWKQLYQPGPLCEAVAEHSSALRCLSCFPGFYLGQQDSSLIARLHKRKCESKIKGPDLIIMSICIRLWVISVTFLMAELIGLVLLPVAWLQVGEGFWREVDWYALIKSCV